MLEYIYYSLEYLYQNYIINTDIKYKAMIQIESLDLQDCYKEMIFISPNELLGTIE